MQKKWERKFPTIFSWEIGAQNVPSVLEILEVKSRSEQLEKIREKELPVQLQQTEAKIGEEGILIKLPSVSGERYYGLGLQMFSFLQNGKRKKLTTNADAIADTGDSHAPVPFFVSSEGYGILIDSARTVEIDFGCSVRLEKETVKVKGDGKSGGAVKTTTEQLYKETQRSSEVTVFIKGAKGAVLYCFAAGSMKGAVEQYNLFSGGGCRVPLWGLGNLYRCYTKADQKQAEAFIEEFSEEDMPFSMIGLEPGWQSHSYSCSFCWSEERFPEPDRLIQKAKEKNMQINLWEQAYVHPTAPFYKEIKAYSGDYEVWRGAVPDFVSAQAAEIYGRHQETLISQGIAAVKLDECDGSDYTGNWFFPDYTKFPSGLCGEEEKNLYGALVMRTIQKSFLHRNRRTYSQIRANYSYAASMPYVLYSDLYDHKQFIRALCNAGFSGLLWAPEVRQCASGKELLRRIQTVVFSPLSLINAWMIPNPPWKQYEEEDILNKVRKLLKLRNQLIPYLYTAFFEYEKYGTPPFRPMVMDFPGEKELWEVDDCYMMGNSLLVAPICADSGEAGRNVYLPEGKWYDFWTDTCYVGGKNYWIETEEIPVFVKDNSILPLAAESDVPAADTVFHLKLQKYGENPEPFMLIEDDGETFAYLKGEEKCLKIQKKNGRWKIPESFRYQISKIKQIGGKGADEWIM